MYIPVYYREHHRLALNRLEGGATIGAEGGGVVLGGHADSTFFSNVSVFSV